MYSTEKGVKGIPDEEAYNRRKHCDHEVEVEEEIFVGTNAAKEDSENQERIVQELLLTSLKEIADAARKEERTNATNQKGDEFNTFLVESMQKIFQEFQQRC